MKIRLWIYFLRQAIASISGNRGVHLLGMGTMVISLLIFGAFLFLFVNLKTWIHGWGHTLSMSVYLVDGIDRSALDGISSTIQNIPGAKIDRFISKEDALRDFKKALGNEASLLEGLSSNPLPASYEVVFSDLESPDATPKKIKTVLEQTKGVAEVQYSEQWLNEFEGLLNMIGLVGAIMGGLLCMGVLLIMTNTIKLTIYSRKHEIEIQKLVGATDWFVKAPFLLEGLIQGLISGGFSVLLLYFSFLFVAEKKVNLLGLTVLDFVFLPGNYIWLIWGISVLLGLTGSFIAVGRFITAEKFVDI